MILSSFVLSLVRKRLVESWYGSCSVLMFDDDDALEEDFAGFGRNMLLQPDALVNGSNGS